MSYIFITKLSLLRANEESLPFCPLSKCLPPPSLPAMFIFAFSVSYLMPLFEVLIPPSSFSPSISLHSPAVLSALSGQASASAETRQESDERNKKKKGQGKFQAKFLSALQFVQPHECRTSQETRGIQLYQTSRSAIIHPDITPSSFSLRGCLEFIISLRLSERLTPRRRLLPPSLVSFVLSSR